MNHSHVSVSLRIKLFVAIALVALLPLLILTVVYGRQTHKIATEKANQSLLLAANQTASQLDTFLTTTQNELALEARQPILSSFLALSPAEREANEEAQTMRRYLQTVSDETPYLRSYALLAADGRNILDTHAPNEGQSEADRAYVRYFQETASPLSAVTPVIQFQPDGEQPLLFVAIPLIDETGDRVGFLRAEFEGTVLQDLITAQIEATPPGSFAVLWDEDLTQLASGREVGTDSPLLKPPTTDAPAAVGTEEDGQLQAVRVPLESQPWLVGYFQPQTAFLAPVESQVRQTALWVATLAGVAVLTAYLAGGWLVRPLISLTETVNSFAAGDLLARAPTQSRDEIGQLARHFNEMAERVGLLLNGLESRTEAMQQEVDSRKATEASLRQQRRFLRQILNINPSFIFAKDRDGRFVMVNQPFADMYNTTIEKMLGKTDADFNPDPEKVAQFRRDDAQVFTTGNELFIPEQRTVNMYGEERWWQTVKRPLRAEDGTITEVLTIVTDITERKQKEEALLIARDRALEANRIKSEILSKAHHELQTPLGAILGYAEMIETGYFGEIAETQKEILQKIIGRTNHLTALIQDLLAQANLEAQKITVRESTINPHDLLAKLHAKMDAKASLKGLDFTSEIAPDFPSFLISDPVRLEQILTNLLGNGIKFTDEGSVHLKFYQPDSSSWAVSVSDTGPGIPEEARAFIFEPFRQVDGSITRQYSGFGLGLSLVKELALTMGGDILLKSEVGKGSTFTLIFPFTPVMEHVI